MGNPQGHPWAARWNQIPGGSTWVNRLGILLHLESYLGMGLVKNAPHPVFPPPTHIQVYTYKGAQVTGTNLPPSHVLPVPPCRHVSPELTFLTFDKHGQGDC